MAELQPDHILTRLGLAWYMEQADKAEEAILICRKLIEGALPMDCRLSHLLVRETSLATEASRYLIALLVDVIEKLKRQSEETESRISRIM